MTYDLHGAWDTETGHQAPLYERPDESWSSQLLNVVGLLILRSLELSCNW